VAKQKAVITHLGARAENMAGAVNKKSSDGVKSGTFELISNINTTVKGDIIDPY